MFSDTDCVLQQADWCGQDRLHAIFLDEEIHLILPDYYAVTFHSFKYFPTNQKWRIRAKIFFDNVLDMYNAYAKINQRKVVVFAF